MNFILIKNEGTAQMSIQGQEKDSPCREGLKDSARERKIQPGLYPIHLHVTEWGHEHHIPADLSRRLQEFSRAHFDSIGISLHALTSLLHTL